MRKNKFYKMALVLIASIAFTSCGGTYYGSSSGSYNRPGNYYHQGGHMGWGGSYYDRGPDYIIVDPTPDIDFGPPEAVQLPMDDW